MVLSFRIRLSAGKSSNLAGTLHPEARAEPHLSPEALGLGAGPSTAPINSGKSYHLHRLNPTLTWGRGKSGGSEVEAAG